MTAGIPGVNMRIALVVEHCHLRGGHERCVAEWARRLARRHQVLVISHSVADLPQGLVQWVPVPQVPGPGAVRYVAFFLMAGMKAREARADVVHSQGPNCPYFHFSSVHTVVRAKYEVLRGSPEFRHEMSARQYASWWLHYHLAMAMERRLYPRPQGTLLPVSRGTAEELVGAYHPPPDRVVTVPNGVDLEVFRPGRPGEREATLRGLGLDPGKTYALFVGGEWARKGLPFALRVIASSTKQVHLVVAGSGPEALYRRQAQRWGIAERVHFLGPQREIQSLYRAGIALLMPSLYEAFSLVSLEAAASGLPLLASKVSGTEELVAQGLNGWVLPPDPPLWAQHLDLLASDSVLRARMGEAAREAASHFTWDRAVARFEELYQLGR